MCDINTTLNQDQIWKKKVSPNELILLVLNLVWKWINPPSSSTHFPKLICSTQPYNMCALFEQIKNQQKKYEQSIFYQMRLYRSVVINIIGARDHPDRYQFEHELTAEINYYKQKGKDIDNLIVTNRYKQIELKNNTDFFMKILSLLRISCFEMNEALKYISI